MFHKGVLGAPAACALLCLLPPPPHLGLLIQLGVLCQTQARAEIRVLRILPPPPGI